MDTVLDHERDSSPHHVEIELTILMPCLNEAETIGTCIRKAKSFLDRSGIRGEVIVADNGSSDGSEHIARSEGAVVVPVSERGYGAALLGGLAAARGIRSWEMQTAATISQTSTVLLKCSGKAMISSSAIDFLVALIRAPCRSSIAILEILCLALSGVVFSEQNVATFTAASADLTRKEYATSDCKLKAWSLRAK